MAGVTQVQPEGQARSLWKPLAASVLLSLALGGGSFYAVHSGALPVGSLWHRLAGAGASGAGASETGATAGQAGRHQPGSYQPGAYVYLDPFVVSLGPQSRSQLLKVALVVEVAPGREVEVEAAKPRVVDVLNVFLRAVDEREFALPSAMERLRAQMLRRVQLVSPEGAVRDVLIQEFIIN